MSHGGVGALTYRIGMAIPGMDTRIAAHATCAKCGEDHWVTVGNYGSNPNFVERRFKEHGWEFDRNNASRCICNACIAQRDAAKVKTAIGVKVEPRPFHKPEPLKLPAKNPMAAAFVAAVREQLSPAQPDDGEETMAQDKPSGDPMQIVRDMSPDIKTRIRAKLDSHFDDAKGMYLDGQSDQTIASELDIPWGAVWALRETAYGPIKTDPVTDEIEKLVGRAHGVIDEIARRMSNVDKEIAAVKKRQEEMTAMMANAKNIMDEATKKLDANRRRLGMQ